MLKILMTAFLSFTIVNGNANSGDDPYSISPTNGGLGQTDTTLGSGGTDGSPYSPIAIPTGQFEVSSWREGLIGRHQMSSIDSYEYVGLTPIRIFTNWYDGDLIEEFSYSREVETITSNSVSTSISLGFEWSRAISGKANIAGLEVGEETGPTVILTIGKTTTYTYTQSEKITVNVKIKHEYTEGRLFAVCSAAHVYKLKCQKWQYDNYWWGDYEVSNSRSAYETYIAMEPRTTIVYKTGEVYGK